MIDFSIDSFKKNTEGVNVLYKTDYVARYEV